MRISQYILATLKKVPKHCETISHQLMLRAGLIRQISSGLYAWLPTGLRVLEKIKNIVRIEMNKNQAIEISMPIVQPAKLWKQSGRWSEYGMELLRFKNRNNQEFILSPTHEEMVSDLIQKEIISYKQFPINIYQIHTKYRDEIRPRFGIIRTKEFIMKDGYSFHVNQTSLQNTYDNMYEIYHMIFNRIGLNFCVVQANPGKIGGTLSHEFQAYSEHGEDNIAVPTTILINKNCENTSSDNHYKKIIRNDDDIVPIKIQTGHPTELMKLIDAPTIDSVAKLINQFNLSSKQIVKTIIVHSKKRYHNNNTLHSLIGLVIRSDHQLDHEKIRILDEIAFPVSYVTIKEIQEITGAQPNLLGSINLNIPYIIDYNVAVMNNFVAGSNINGKYFFGVNWNRDWPIPKIADLYFPINNNKNRNMHKKNILSIRNCTEIGHIFQLGKKYLKTIQNHMHMNHQCNLTMGCYGMGISRMIAVIIEQNYDKHGILWPEEIAPFKLAIIPINMYHSINVRNITEKIYNQLLSISEYNILLDDRKTHPGTMFYDIDLIGIPHILIISDQCLNNQEIEYKHRKTGIIKKIKLDILLQYLIQHVI